MLRSVELYLLENFIFQGKIIPNDIFLAKYFYYFDRKINNNLKV